MSLLSYKEKFKRKIVCNVDDTIDAGSSIKSTCSLMSIKRWVFCRWKRTLDGPVTAMTSVSGETTIGGKMPFASETTTNGETSLTNGASVGVFDMPMPGENTVRGENAGVAETSLYNVVHSKHLFPMCQLWVVVLLCLRLAKSIRHAFTNCFGIRLFQF